VASDWPRATCAAIPVGQNDRARSLVERANARATDAETQAEHCLSRARIEYETVEVEAAVAALVHAADLVAEDPVRAARCLTTASRIAWTANDRSLVGAINQRLLALAGAGEAPLKGASGTFTSHGSPRAKSSRVIA